MCGRGGAAGRGGRLLRPVRADRSRPRPSPPLLPHPRMAPTAPMKHPRTLALFDVDGTLTVPRKVRPARCANRRPPRHPPRPVHTSQSHHHADGVQADAGLFAGAAQGAGNEAPRAARRSRRRPPPTRPFPPSLCSTSKWASWAGPTWSRFASSWAKTVRRAGDLGGGDGARARARASDGGSRPLKRAGLMP